MSTNISAAEHHAVVEKLRKDIESLVNGVSPLVAVRSIEIRNILNAVHRVEIKTQQQLSEGIFRYDSLDISFDFERNYKVPSGK